VMKSEDFLDLAHGQPFLRQPVFLHFLVEVRSAAGLSNAAS